MLAKNTVPALVALSGLLVLSACAGAQRGEDGQPGQPEKVAFEFDWPDDLVMNVDLQRTRQLQANGGSQTFDGHVTFDMIVDRQDGELAIDTDRFEWQGEPARQIPEVINRTVLTGVPGFVVANVGDFMRTEDVTKLLDVYAQASNVDLSPLAEAERTQVDQIVRQTVEATVTDLWNNLVGFWAGRELAVGDPIERRNNVPIPLLGGAQVPVVLTYQVAGRVPCEEEAAPEAEARCVRLELRSAPEPQALAKAIAARQQQLMPPAPEGVEPGAQPEVAPETEAAPEGEAPAVPEAQTAPEGQLPPETPAPARPAPSEPVLQDLQNEVDVVLITEPDGLVPHRLERTQLVSATVLGPDGQTHQQRQEDKAIYRFTHAER